MNLFSAIRNIFVKEQTKTTPSLPEIEPIIVEKRRLPKSLLAEYRQDFSKYNDFHSKHRTHQLNALRHLRDETIGQITIPTGTGKTRIQVDVHISDMIEKTKNGQTGVYVIGAHRLALCSQLLYDIVEVAIPCGLDFNVLQVNSNNFSNDAIRTQLRKEGKIDDNLRAFSDLISKGLSTTRQDEVLNFVNNAKSNNRHVIIVATYHSINKLAILPEIDICTYDEAHITLGENFTDNISQVQPIIKKNFFFTATRKVIGTFSGMNDTENFGEVLYSLSPRSMIEAGEIVPPRLHSIRISEDAEDGDYDNNKMLIKTISESFSQHKAMIKQCSSNPDLIGAKLLVSCTGSKELKTIIASIPFRVWCDDHNIKVFSFSTNDEVGYRFNFKEVTRTELFSKMNDLTDTEDAIIFHIDILTEGIDLPSITGVMPLRNLNQSKLIQTIGRATRLLSVDRQNLYSGTISPNQSNKYIKPYCWFLVPQLFESLGDFNSMKRLLRDIMNSYDVRPEEFSSLDRFIANFEAVLPKVTSEDEIAKREKECNLSHIFEDIYLGDWVDLMSQMNPDEQFTYIKKELEAYDALKHPDVLANPKMYYDLYDNWSQKTSFQTINEWINDVEILANTMPDLDSALKLRGDMLEVLSEIFFNAFQNDEAVGIKEYAPVAIDEDFGVDATGINPNGTKVAVQCKYKNFEPVTYSELAKTFTSGLLVLKCDLMQSNSIYVFTTAVAFSSAVDKNLGSKIVKIDRNVISRKIDNNRTFWEFAFNQIYETLEE